MIRNDEELRKWLRVECHADERTQNILVRHKEDWIRLPCSSEKAFERILAVGDDGEPIIRKIHNMGTKSTKRIMWNVEKGIGRKD